MTETCPICGQEFEDSDGRPAAFKLQAHLRLKRDEAHLAARDDVPRETEVIVPDEVKSPYDSPSAEQRPTTPPPAAGTRKWWQRRPKDAVALPGGHPKERSPRRAGISSGRRLPAADFLGDVYGGIGSIVGRATPYRATSKAITANAPVAGYMLDEAVKGTIVDRAVVQPGVRAQQKYTQVAGLFEVPVLVFLIEQEGQKGEEANRQKMDGLFMMLRSSIRRSLPAMVPALKKLKEDEKKIAEAVAELYPDLPEGADPVDAILAEWFAPDPQAQPMPEEAMA